MGERKHQALDGKRLNAFGMFPEDLTIVGLDTDDGPEHPCYDERIHDKIDDAFVKNIERFGVLEDVLVRKNGPLVEVLVGRKRVLAQRMVNEKLVAQGQERRRVRVSLRQPTSDAETLAIIVSENEQRHQDDPMVRAKKAARMVSFGGTEEDVSIAFGITRAHTKNLLGLLDLDPKVQKMVSAGELRWSAAVQLRDLTRKDQVVEVTKLVSAGASVEEARRQRKARNAGTTAPVLGKRPTAAVLRELTSDDAFMRQLGDVGRGLLRWFGGDAEAIATVPGLADKLKATTEKK